VNANEREEITASVAAHAELGPRYDTAVAEGLVERIGEEIDRRVDARLRGADQAGRSAPPAPDTRATRPGPVPRPVAPSPEPAQPPAHQPQRQVGGVTGMILGLGSIGLGVGATAAVVSHHADPVAQVFMILLIWCAIAIVNIAHSQRR
jgi:nitrate/nitrite transporter NarK